MKITKIKKNNPIEYEDIHAGVSVNNYKKEPLPSLEDQLIERGRKRAEKEPLTGYASKGIQSKYFWE